jgi:hypothetical protein
VVNFTLPIASSSEAEKGEVEDVMPDKACVNGLTWVKSRLEGSQSVILEHVQKRLHDLIFQNGADDVKERPTVFPALSKPRKRILAFLCNRPAQGCELESGVTGRKQLTQLGEDVPEPVDDEHYARKGEERR